MWGYMITQVWNNIITLIQLDLLKWVVVNRRYQLSQSATYFSMKKS